MGIKGSDKTFIEWRKSAIYEPYLPCLEVMQAHVEAIISGKSGDLGWFLEHPPLYTAGPNAHPDEIRSIQHPLFRTDRGGKTTYHGPGQRLIYLMSDLRHRGQDLHAHVQRLEEWTILVLASLGVKAERREGRVGLWVIHHGREEKIAAIGVHVKKWVTSHGLALNVCPNLAAFDDIIPCGLKDYGVTSLEALGVKVSIEEIDELFIQKAHKVF